jgi:hypothetical protein
MKGYQLAPLSYVYPDTGCAAAPSCLSCPLARCKYDDPIWFRRQQQQTRDLGMATTMRLEGLTVEAAAERFSVTVRTIYRIQARARQTGLEAGV